MMFGILGYFFFGLIATGALLFLLDRQMKSAGMVDRYEQSLIESISGLDEVLLMALMLVLIAAGWPVAIPVLVLANLLIFVRTRLINRGQKA